MGGGCNYDPTASSALTGLSPGVPIDYINVYNDDTPANNAPPLLHEFELTGDSCGGPGFVYTASLDPNATCTVHFNLAVDSGTGANNFKSHEDHCERGTRHEPSQSQCSSNGIRHQQRRSILPRGQITLKPNAVDPTIRLPLPGVHAGRSPSVQGELRADDGKGQRSGLYEDTPSQQLQGDVPLWGVQRELRHGSAPCRPMSSHPLESNPLVSAELTNGSGNPIPNSYPEDGAHGGQFTVELRTYGIDQQRTYLIRDSVQASANRSHAIDCGQGNGASSLGQAVIDGCPDPVGVNRHDDGSVQRLGRRAIATALSPCRGIRAPSRRITPPASRARTLITGYRARVPRVSHLHHLRFAYIFLTSWGRSSTPSRTEPTYRFVRSYASTSPVIITTRQQPAGQQERVGALWW